MRKLVDAETLKKKFAAQRDKIVKEKKYGWEFTVNGFNGAIFITGAEAAQNGVDGWIPCTERLPETEEYVLCTTETKKGLRQVVRGYYMHDVKEWACGMNRNVLAWAPMPEPWKGKE